MQFLDPFVLNCIIYYLNAFLPSKKWQSPGFIASTLPESEKMVILIMVVEKVLTCLHMSVLSTPPLPQATKYNINIL